jgi:N-acetylmuramoyl-L-alanine amidase
MLLFIASQPMKSITLLSVGAVVVASAAFSFERQTSPVRSPDLSSIAAATDTPAAVVAQVSTVAEPRPGRGIRSEMWVRPEGPLKVALQAGHWKAAEAPDEQSGLRTNGTRGGGKAEWEVNLEIAQRTGRLLEAAGYQVEILPTTIPPGYFADLFLSIHADGNNSTSVAGYRASAPRRDQTGRAGDFSDLLEEYYGAATGLRHYPTVTRRMQNYYAFNYRRYDHALHPMTVAAILETGFLTNPGDRQIIVNDPDRAARGIADAVKLFLKTMPLEPQMVEIGRDPNVRPWGFRGDRVASRTRPPEAPGSD